MSIESSKIITTKDLKNFKSLKKKISENGEVYIFENDKPSYVVMSIEQYDMMFDKMKENYEASPENNENLETLINKVGKKVFVDYYYIFKDDINPEEALIKDNFTLASRRSRSSTARKIFKEGLQIAALNNILNSSRIGTATINKAKEIIEKESSLAFKELNGENSNKYSLKIGKMAHGIFATLIFNGEIKADEISGFLDLFYCKNIFGLSYPLLKELKPEEDVDSAKRDSKGYNRYYETVIEVNSKRYLICSQWVEELHRISLNQWVISKMVFIASRKLREAKVDTQFTIKTLLIEYWEYLGYDLRKIIDQKIKLDVATNPSIVEVGNIEELCEYKKV